MRPLCLLGSTSSHTNHDYHIGNKSNCDDACAVGRLISQLVSRHYKWYRTLPCRTVKTEDKKKGNERTKGGRESIDTRHHWTRDRIHQTGSMSLSLSLSSHMVLRRRKACRLFFLGIESAYLVEATVPPCAYSITAGSHHTTSYSTSPHITSPPLP